MPVTEYLLTVLATALGGFDPAPMLIMAAALGAGVRRRHVVGATAALLAGTAGWGAVLTMLAGPRLLSVPWHRVLRYGVLAAWLELALGAVLAGYVVFRVVRRLRRGGTAQDEEKPRAAWGLYLTAVVFVAIVIFDVPFDLHVAAAATQGPVLAGLGWVAWAVISQAPVTVLALLTLSGRQRGIARRMTAWWRTVSPYAWLAVTAALGLAALFLLADAGRMLLLGRFLVG